MHHFFRMAFICLTELINLLVLVADTSTDIPSSSAFNSPSRVQIRLAFESSIEKRWRNAHLVSLLFAHARRYTAATLRKDFPTLEFEPRDQFEQRQKKLEQIQALGFDPFPREFRWTRHARGDSGANIRRPPRRSSRPTSAKFASPAASSPIG